MPAVSVVIPTFKRPTRLQATIEAVLNQTLKPAVIVIADNDPAQSARPVAEKLKEEGAPVDYVQADAVRGPAFARNQGAAHCSTEWIAFHDDDDDWSDDYLETAITLGMEKERDVVFTWIRMGRDTDAAKRLRENMTLDEVVVGNPGVTGSNIVAKKAAFDALAGFDQEFLASEDIDFLLNVIDSNTGYAVNQNIQVIRVQHDDGQLSDLSGGAVADGSSRLLNKYGHRISRKARNRLRAKIHMATFASSRRFVPRVYHAFMAAALGDRRPVRALLGGKL